VKEPQLGRDFEEEDWPGQILTTLQGSTSETDLLDTIRDEDNQVRRRELLAEALYYMGQGRLANGETDIARSYFAAVVNLKVLYFIEHHLALAEIMKMQN
jgi:lipoprotein NlpI